MTQNNNTTDGSNFGGGTNTGATGSAGSTSGTTGATSGTAGSTTGTTGTTDSTYGTTGATTGTAYAGIRETPDNYRTTGDTIDTRPHAQHVEAHGFNEGRSSYQQSGPREVTTSQRRTASSPSRNVVIGSAVAGAIAGGVLPFMLSGRKSRETRQVQVNANRSGPSAHVDRAPTGTSGHDRNATFDRSVTNDLSSTSDRGATNDRGPTNDRSSGPDRR